MAYLRSYAKVTRNNWKREMHQFLDHIFTICQILEKCRKRKKRYTPHQPSAARKGVAIFAYRMIGCVNWIRNETLSFCYVLDWLDWRKHPRKQHLKFSVQIWHKQFFVRFDIFFQQMERPTVWNEPAWNDFHVGNTVKWLNMSCRVETSIRKRRRWSFLRWVISIGKGKNAIGCISVPTTILY